MKTKHIVIGLFAAALIGGGIWWFSRRKKSQEQQAGGEESLAGESEIVPPATLDENKIKSAGAVSSSGGATSFPPTPFKNADEGNAFRAWVNKNYPDRAKALQLDPKGSFDNQTIRKAYSELGSAYQKSISDADYAAKLAAEKKKLEDQYNALTQPLNVVVPKSSNPDVAKKGFVNVRTSPMINDGAINNRAIPLKIGASVEFVKDVKGSDQLTWYAVKYKNPLSKANSIGYIRSDVSEKKTIRVPKSSVA